MSRTATAIEAATVCPRCEHARKWVTDSSRLRMDGGQVVLNLDCPQCAINFDLEMVTGRTTLGPGRRTTAPVAVVAPVAAEPKPDPSPRGPKKDNWTHGGEGTSPKQTEANWGFEPILPDHPADPTGFRPYLPDAAPTPKAATAFAPALPPPVAPKLAPPTAAPKPPAPKPAPAPPEDSPAMSTPAQPKTGFWKKFSGLPLWQQWGIILVVVAVIGTAIFLSPLGESRAVEVKK